MTSSIRSPTPDMDTIQSSGTNPFASPYASQLQSAMASSTALHNPGPPRFFHSRRIKKGEVERPWVGKKDPREKWQLLLPVGGIVLGFLLSGFLIYEQISKTTSHDYCLVLEDTFSEGFNTNTWTKEVSAGGFGNGEFELTTSTDENVYVENGELIIKPTLMDADLINSDAVIDLYTDTTYGLCTYTAWSDCVAVTNTTNGTTINPVKSGRINTKKSATIKYGRVEVVAKNPVGDWLWPAIWMLPVNNTYGVWPASGEIDIMEARGNNYTYPDGGNDIATSTLHWGPDTDDDGYYLTTGSHSALHTTWSAGYHTYGLEWSEKYVYMYYDTRLLQIIYVNFNEPFWTRGNFPAANDTGGRLVNPWALGSDSTPFDQDFYLIINVAVGGTNGWFPDGEASKPWVDASSTAKKDFWNAQKQWYPTWAKQGQMAIKSVKMWQQGGYNGCKGK